MPSPSGSEKLTALFFSPRPTAGDRFQSPTASPTAPRASRSSIRADHLGMRLTGLGLGTKTVHHIGHMIEGKEGDQSGGGQDFANGMGEFATRELIMNYHMENVAKMAAKLQAVPEGDGTMLDNTVIVYLSDHGEKHHSNCYEWPMVALGNIGGKLKAGRYLHVPFLNGIIDIIMAIILKAFDSYINSGLL